MGEPAPWRSSPSIAMFGGIFVLLLAWSLANPMFAAPDEDLHLARSQSTWLGDLSPPYSTDGVPVGAVRCFAFKPNTTADCMDTTWGPPTGSQLLPTTNGYPPFFSIIAGAPTRIVDGLFGAYVVRIWLAFLTSLVVTAALRRLAALRADGLAVTAAVVALTPMSAFLMASVNPSGLSIAFGTLAVASGLAWRTRPDPRELAVFAASIGAIVLLRRDGLVIGGLLALGLLGPFAPTIGRGIRHGRAAAFGAFLAIALTGSIFLRWSWSFFVDQLTTDFAWSNWRITLAFVDHYLRQLVGIFGWLDTLVSEATMALWFICTGLLAAIPLLTRRRRATEGVFLLACCAALPIAFGFFRVQYFQTRYVLPLWIAGFVLVVVLHVPSNLTAVRWPTVRRLLAVGVFLTHQTAFLTNLHRYSHGVTAEWRLFTEAAWAPPLLSTGGAVALGLAGSMLFARVILVGSRAEPGPSPVPADPT